MLVALFLILIHSLSDFFPTHGSKKMYFRLLIVLLLFCVAPQHQHHKSGHPVRFKSSTGMYYELQGPVRRRVSNWRINTFLPWDYHYLLPDQLHEIDGTKKATGHLTSWNSSSMTLAYNGKEKGRHSNLIHGSYAGIGLLALLFLVYACHAKILIVASTCSTCCHRKKSPTSEELDSVMTLTISEKSETPASSQDVLIPLSNDNKEAPGSVYSIIMPMSTISIPKQML